MSSKSPPVPPEHQLTDDELLQQMEQWKAFGFQIAQRWAKGKRHIATYEEFHAAVIQGFVEAGRRFDKRRGLLFATFAKHWADKECRQLIREASGMKPTQYTDPKYRSARYIRSYHEKYTKDGEDCKIEDIAVKEESDEVPEFPPDFWKKVKGVLNNARMRKIIDLRYRQGLTLAATGERLNLSRERVRQIEDMALRLIVERVKFGDCVGQ